MDWSFLQTIYGWSATQYQAWTRGQITVNSSGSQAYHFFTDGIVELWVDDEHYFGGDFYAFRRSPIILNLTPGSHQLDIRLVRDTRAMGGIGEPTIEARLELRLVSEAVSIVEGSILTPDLVGDWLAGSYISISVQNAGTSKVEIASVRSDNLSKAASGDHSEDEIDISLTASTAIVIQSGQTRPVPLEFRLLRPFTASSQRLRLLITSGDGESPFSLGLDVKVDAKTPASVHKMTYLHPSGIVSYAMIRPPALHSSAASASERLPIFICLHGAGVDADSPDVSHCLDDVGDVPAWIILPSGVTSWCGDDWHQWGWADVEAAVAAIPSWIDAVRWKGAGVDPDRLLVAGHSNGGQGVWYGLLHRPDRVIAAAPVSGYTSIQKYVPYTFWRETDPRRSGVVQAALNTYRHELLIDNAKHVPLFVQHGDADDNVPVFHARRMVQLAKHANVAVTYHELKGKGHWFDGIMTTEGMKNFIRNNIGNQSATAPLPLHFKLTVANPGDTQWKFGFRIDQLVDPGQTGSLVVDSTDSSISVATSNVRTFRILTKLWTSWKPISINGRPVPLPSLEGHDHITFRKDPSVDDAWSVSSNPQTTISGLTTARLTGRRGNQLGNIDAILRTRGPFTVIWHGRRSAAGDHLALQVARNLHQYFAADANIIVSDPSAAAAATTNPTARGNVISLGIGSDIPTTTDDKHPIALSDASLTIRDHTGASRTYRAGDAGLAAIFLRPLDDERLELVVWGATQRGLRLAARLVPLLTGAGQPDFVVLTHAAAERGVDGALALGFFDSDWKVAASSFLA